MTAATRDAVAGAVLPGQLQARGEHALKNLPEPLAVFALVPPGDQPALPIDPVCRMAVDPGSAPAQTHHEGHTYYFCSSECAWAFRERPGRYVRN
jgi:YHS domain-containing protein